MAAKTAVIFGAGKIARGFIAHLLTLSEFHITFVEKLPELVSLLQARQKYKVHILNAPQKNIVITGFEILSTQNTEQVAARVASASMVFVSVGGPNLPQVAPLLAEGFRRAFLEKRLESLNVILCENYFEPAKWLRQLVVERLQGGEEEWFKSHVGIVEALVLRSAIEPTLEMKAEDPLSLKSQDLWELPADEEAFVGEIPPVQGLAPKAGFRAGLIQKLFTYNAINAVIAYVGYLKGYEMLSDAANDPELVALARTASRESGEALCKTYGFDPKEQEQFAESAISKYQKREIIDPIERNARDPVRKLSRNDRLVGPASLALECGCKPVALSRAIGAALHYDSAGDPAAQRIQGLIRDQGVEKTIQDICGINSGAELAKMIITAFHQWEASKGSTSSMQTRQSCSSLLRCVVHRRRAFRESDLQQPTMMTRVSSRHPPSLATGWVAEICGSSCRLL